MHLVHTEGILRRKPAAEVDREQSSSPMTRVSLPNYCWSGIKLISIGALQQQRPTT